jgi:hypothetical protein
VRTWACLELGLTGDLPLTLITTAVVFPIVDPGVRNAA